MPARTKVVGSQYLDKLQKLEPSPVNDGETQAPIASNSCQPPSQHANHIAKQVSWRTIRPCFCLYSEVAKSSLPKERLSDSSITVAMYFRNADEMDDSDGQRRHCRTS
jgi:hypothetical protein